MFKAISLGIFVLTLAVDSYAGGDGHGASRYKVEEIPNSNGDPNCNTALRTITSARRFNDRGFAVGSSECFVASGDPAFPYQDRGPRAFAWSRRAGSYDLPLLAGATTFALARDVNESNVAVGLEFGASIGFRAPLWPPDGGVTDALDPTACNFGSFGFARAEAINDFGSVAGNVRRFDESGTCSTLLALRRASGEEFLGPGGRPAAINKHEIVVGSGGVDPVKWSPAGGVVPLATLDGNVQFGSATDINDRNEVAGYIEHLNPDTQCSISTVAMVWDADGIRHDLPGLAGAPYAYTSGINKRGDVVGNAEFVDVCAGNFVPTSRAVVWQRGRIHDLNDLIPRRLGITLFSASDINSRGQILARGYRPAEPLKACPYLEFDPNTGEQVYNDTLRCPNTYAFLLTPVDH